MCTRQLLLGLLLWLSRWLLRIRQSITVLPRRQSNWCGFSYLGCNPLGMYWGKRLRFVDGPQIPSRVCLTTVSVYCIHLTGANRVFESSLVPGLLLMYVSDPVPHEESH